MLIQLNIIPVGFGMMQGAPQFVQPGIQPFASMQQQRMMSQGQPMMAQGQPMISQGQPMMSHGQPMMPHGQPVMAAGQRMMVPGMYPVSLEVFFDRILIFQD